MSESNNFRCFSRFGLHGTRRCRSNQKIVWTPLLWRRTAHSHRARPAAANPRPRLCALAVCSAGCACERPRAPPLRSSHVRMSARLLVEPDEGAQQRKGSEAAQHTLHRRNSLAFVSAPVYTVVLARRAVSVAGAPGSLPPLSCTLLAMESRHRLPRRRC